MTADFFTPARRRLLLAGLILLSSIGGASYFLFSSGRAVPPTAPPQTVSATVFPLYDIVRNVAGDALQVQLILPTNAEPHTFEPTPTTLQTLRGAAVVYAIGHGLDQWITPLATSVAVPVRVVDDHIALRSATDNGTGDGMTAAADNADPHYWLAADNAAVMAATVADDLAGRFPSLAPVFRRNLAAYLATLKAADAAVRAKLAPLTDRRFAAFHGAYRYFAAAYNLDFVGAFEAFPGREPSPRYLLDLQRNLDRTGTRTIYAEPSFNTDALRAFAAENGYRVGTLDDLGGAPGRDSLTALLLYDAQALAENQR